MSALPLPIPGEPDSRRLPDYLPARMVNQFVFCPRLFHYMWVDQLMAVNAEVIEGRGLHKRVDGGSGALPKAEAAMDASDRTLHSRSVTLSSESLRVIAKLDIVELEGATATPVDYKRGEPREEADGKSPWPADRIQIALQMAVLRENGFLCDRGVLFYARTKQRIEVAWTEALMLETQQAVAAAWEAAANGQIPPPLVDAPQCPKCSLVGICLPDETLAAARSEMDSPQLRLFPESGVARKPPRSEGLQQSPLPAIRRLSAPRSETTPVYFNTQGLRIGKTGDILEVKEKTKVVQTVRMREVHQVNLMGNIQITTQAVQTLCEAEIPIAYFSQGGWFYGLTQGLGTKNIHLRQKQFRAADNPNFCLSLARSIVSGKIRNQRTMLMRNHREPAREMLAQLKYWSDRAERAGALEDLLGIEGMGARIYFANFQGMLKTDEGEARLEGPGSASPEFPFWFEHRNRRPPRDPVNAMLSLAYSILAKEWTITCARTGFDPLLGFYHQPRFGRPSLALDLMEPFRPLVADSAVITAINTGMVRSSHFVQAAESFALTPDGRKIFLHALELRLDQLVTHPLFEYKVSYRRLFEVQARLLVRVLEGELTAYPVFVTR